MVKILNIKESQNTVIISSSRDFRKILYVQERFVKSILLYYVSVQTYTDGS